MMMGAFDHTSAQRALRPNESAASASPANEVRERSGGTAVLHKGMTGAVGLAVVLLAFAAPAATFDEAEYPDLSGQWRKPAGIGNQWDQTKPLGRAQEPPLTPEYQAIFEASMADQQEGGQRNDPPSRCVPFAMPRVMTVVFSMEILVKPDTTHILFDHSLPRRIYTDGRDWPKEIEPSFLGYSIGRWVDEDGDGYDVLEIETRGLKGPRTYEGTGLPFHSDNATILEERIYLDRTRPGILHDEITTIDHELTRPWTVTKTYRRDPGQVWFQWNCAEDNHHVLIGQEDYFLSADGMLMPGKRDQAPPDLRYFKRAPN
jgi:hypothetical protein